MDAALPPQQSTAAPPGSRPALMRTWPGPLLSVSPQVGTWPAKGNGARSRARCGPWPPEEDRRWQSEPWASELSGPRVTLQACWKAVVCRSGGHLDAKTASGRAHGPGGQHHAGARSPPRPRPSPKSLGTCPCGWCSSISPPFWCHGPEKGCQPGVSWGVSLGKTWPPATRSLTSLPPHPF